MYIKRKTITKKQNKKQNKQIKSRIIRKKTIQKKTVQNQEYQKKKSKEIKTQKQKQHLYFINNCKYDNVSYLNPVYLEQHLQKLGILPDKSMKVIERIDKEFARKNKMSYKEFCNDFCYSIKNKIPSIPPRIIKADIFFYDITKYKLSQRIYNYNKFLSNILNINYDNILRKNILYDNVYKYSPEIATKYLIETFNIDEVEKYQFPEYYILRPTIASGGTDIIYIHNKKELNDAIEFYNTNKNYKGKYIYGNNVVAAKFISDLLLFQGKKFHLRIYYMISCINNTVNTFVLDNGDIITAKEKYDLKTPFTKAKHDTHFKSTEKYFTIANDFTTENLGIEMNNEIYNKIYNEIKIVCSGISKLIIKSKSNSSFLFDNQKNGFHIFGLDIFIKNDLSPVLIECNMNPGFGTRTENGQNILSKNIYNWINETVLEPLFKYNDPMISRKHHTYINL